MTAELDTKPRPRIRSDGVTVGAGLNCEVAGGKQRLAARRIGNRIGVRPSRLALSRPRCAASALTAYRRPGGGSSSRPGRIVNAVALPFRSRGIAYGNFESFLPLRLAPICLPNRRSRNRTENKPESKLVRPPCVEKWQSTSTDFRIQRLFHMPYPCIPEGEEAALVRGGNHP